MPHPSLFNVLALSLVSGEQTLEQVVLRANATLGKTWPWMPDVAQRYLTRWLGKTRPRHAEVIEFLRHDASINKHILKIGLATWLTDTQRMQPVEAARSWNIPTIESVGELALWLELSVADLEWFADLKALGYKHGNRVLRHYRYRVVQKKSGGVRLIESPKERLKEIQRRVLAGILNAIPIHEAVHGFRQGRSVQSFAAPHVQKVVLLRMDLEDFFPSISGVRIQTFFRTAGYPESVADLLGGLCTNSTPQDVIRSDIYARPHLPQGAPTSPALANLCAYRLDARLAGLAKSAGAVYTRYADDLAFSGDADFERRVERFAVHVAAIGLQEGFRVQHHKTRIMRHSVSQHLTGMTVNEHLNIPHREFDQLKATLTNCIRQGPRSQNLDGVRDFRAYLQGRVAYVALVNPARGAKLSRLLEQIRWA